jgi:hypothetical protein
MASKDGIGAPRRPETINRDKAILAEAKRLQRREKRGLRASDAKRVVEGEISDNQIYYALRRLAQAGLLERRDGYSWYPVVQG